jgi:hypothetical protein
MYKITKLQEGSPKNLLGNHVATSHRVVNHTRCRYVWIYMYIPYIYIGDDICISCVFVCVCVCSYACVRAHTQRSIHKLYSLSALL